MLSMVKKLIFTWRFYKDNVYPRWLRCWFIYLYDVYLMHEDEILIYNKLA